MRAFWKSHKTRARVRRNVSYRPNLEVSGNSRPRVRRVESETLESRARRLRGFRSCPSRSRTPSRCTCTTARSRPTSPPSTAPCRSAAQRPAPSCCRRRRRRPTFSADKSLDNPPSEGTEDWGGLWAKRKARWSALRFFLSQSELSGATRRAPSGFSLERAFI